MYYNLTTLPEKTSPPGIVPFSRVSLVPPSVVYLQAVNEWFYLFLNGKKIVAD